MVDPRIANGIAAVRQVLIDPPSARFEDTFLTQVGEKTFLCGAVNSNNSMDGDSRITRFLLDVQDNAVVLERIGNLDFDRDWNDYCRDAPALARAPTTTVAAPAVK